LQQIDAILLNYPVFTQNESHLTYGEYYTVSAINRQVH